MGHRPGLRVPVNRTQAATLKSLPWKLSSPSVPWFGIFTAPVPSNVKAWPTIPGAKVTPSCNVPLLVMLWMLSALSSAGHQAAKSVGGNIQGANGSALAGGLLTRIQIDAAIRHVRRASLALAVVSIVFIVDSRAVSPFLPESLRAVAKKVTGATSLCVCSAMQRPDRAKRLQPGNYFGAREPTILSTRRSASFNWP